MGRPTFHHWAREGPRAGAGVAADGQHVGHPGLGEEAAVQGVGAAEVQPRQDAAGVAPHPWAGGGGSAGQSGRGAGTGERCNVERPAGRPATQPHPGQATARATTRTHPPAHYAHVSMGGHTDACTYATSKYDLKICDLLHMSACLPQPGNKH